MSKKSPCADSTVNHLDAPPSARLDKLLPARSWIQVARLVISAPVFFTLGCNQQPKVTAAKSITDSSQAATANRLARDTLPLASESSEHEEVKRLVLAGEPIDATDSLGKTALYYAAVNSDTPLTIFLLDHGANPNFQVHSKAGETPLFAAIHHRNLECVRILLNRGANPNAITIGGMPPIFIAAYDGFLPAVQLLLDHGAKANAGCDSGLTALTVTNPNGLDTSTPEDSLLAVDKLLLDHGADPTIKDRDGYTSGELARFMGYKRVADLLDSSGSPANKSTRPTTNR